MIKKNEKGRFEVEFYDSITYENGNMICHMKNVDIIVSSKHGLPVTEEDLWRFMSDNNWLEVTGVSKKQDFSYAVNCFNYNSKSYCRMFEGKRTRGYDYFCRHNTG